ncbi:MAG: hypothetical protein B9S34_13820 [Opitutia bacterium Tous-C1TDCM]|nr:MAG: hypothetical protein B9S34_13820 [Opitutae bacterium Tous-C1TDCM]
MNFRLPVWLALACVAVAAPAATPSSPLPSYSGIYPHLAFFNSQGECGTGAVVPWADRLWVVTYSPHMPKGSDDKLYSIDTSLRQTIHPESIGGTPANRFIHRESQQLFIGPYAVDAKGKVRAIPFTQMYGRPTGNARHLTDPANKIYYASMEEGFYEVDVHTLAVTELFRDEQVKEPFRRADLPGYHGKGLYSGQGRLIYANNGEHGTLARTKPDIPSGVLAEWDGVSDKWTHVRRNQFTEVTGPGDLYGNSNPATDPVWSVGWDHRSLILQVLDAGKWHAYRLPKGSHSYDGAHGWNTEWPRIRDIGEKDLLMTMHGTFWRFPRTFSPRQSAGIAPRSNYLKVVGDFARWGDRLVLGCDDTAQSEFLNKRKAKGNLAGPGQSQSNLWFIDPAELDRFGPAIGRGAVWQDEPVKKAAPSDAYLFSGYDQRILHLVHGAGAAVTFTLEVDRAGDGRWTRLRDVVVPAAGYAWTLFTAGETGAWIRVRADRDLAQASAIFSFRNADRRTRAADARFAGLAADSARPASGGLLHARGQNKRTLAFAAAGQNAFYEMGPDMKLRRTDEPGAHAWMQEKVSIPRDAVALDAASVIYTDEAGKRFRLPKATKDYAAAGPFGAERTAREVCTERDLLNCAGTFYELPAENAGGIAKLRPVATHARRVHDFATWRGLLLMSGVAADAPKTNPHLVRSADGQAALWAGGVDDLWSFGKPVGEGGPWKDSAVAAGVPSDPYLMTGYDSKSVAVSHTAAQAVTVRIEVDLTGTGRWVEYAALEVPAGRPVTHRFPAGFQAYWVRTVSSATTTATAWFTYE